MGFCLVESARVKQGGVRCPLFGRQSLPQEIVFQVRPETFEGHCCVELAPGFSSMVPFDLSHFSNHLWDVVVRNRLRPRELRIGAESSHECSPGEFAGRQRANYAVRGRAESLDIGNVGCHLPLEKIPDLLIEVGSLDLGCVSRSLCFSVTATTEKTGKNQSEHFYCKEHSSSHRVVDRLLVNE